MKALVAGGSGFVGQVLCRILVKRGWDVTVASRRPTESELPPGVDTVAVDVTRSDLAPAVSDQDVVVNLFALPSHVRPRNQTHEAVHFEGTRSLLTASEQTGVDRFVQMSALGVESDVSTAYLDAKRGAERLVRSSSLDWVIYRPSVAFGDGCRIIPFIERVIPPYVAPLPGGGTMRIQPIWIEDLAPMLADGAEDSRHVGRTYEIGGPESLTFAEVLDLICDRHVVVPLPMPLAATAFAIAGYLPFVPFDLDQYRVFRLDNTTADNDVTAFGASEADLLTLGEYLSGKRKDTFVTAT